MEIKGETYQVSYEDNHGAVIFKGSLRLGGMEEYAPITNLLQRAAEQESNLKLDLRELNFLNSSGINMLSKFVIAVRRKEGVKVQVYGSKQISWQGKSLKNLERLMPGLTLHLE